MFLSTIDASPSGAMPVRALSKKQIMPSWRPAVRPDHGTRVVIAGGDVRHRGGDDVCAVGDDGLQAAERQRSGGVDILAISDER